MSIVPIDLYTPEIKSFIKYLVEDQDAKYFDDLDTIHKDKLVALGIRALGCDIEIVIGSQANQHLCAYLLSYDRDDEIELKNAIQDAAYEKFSSYYDQMISDMKEERKQDDLRDAGFCSYQDSQTGETLWRRYA